jgi:hypothetical protein
MMRSANKLFFVFYLFLFAIDLQAQITDSTKLEQKYVSFDTIVKRLEATYHVRFFYNPNWFDGREFSPGISQKPLPEAISLITKITQLSVSKLNDTYYVLVPQSLDTEDKSAESKFYIIGDMMNYGSKSSAKVKGTVVDANNNQPLRGARIFISDLNHSVVTDLSGKFSLTLPVGEHEFKVNYQGFEENTRKVKVVSDGEITIDMFIKTISIGEVAITSDKIDQYYRRTKMSVMNIDAKSIKELPTNLGETDVIKGLSLMPGVQTTGEFGSGFNVRGGGADQNLVLIEDVPIFNTSHLFGLTSILNPDGISDVTLYKGGIPVTFGERASSILSVKMGDADLKHVQVKGGIGLLSSRLTLEIPVKEKLTIIVGGRTSYSDWMLRRIPDPDLANSSAGFNDMNFFASYNISNKDKLTLFAYSSFDKFGISGTENYSYGNTLGSVNYSHRFSSKVYTNIMGGISLYKASLVENDTLKPTDSYKTSNDMLYKNLKWNLVYKLNDKHILTIGANGFLYDIDPGKVVPYGVESKVGTQNIQKVNGLEWAGFIGDDYKINDKISVEFGVRYSGYNYLGPRKVNIYDPGFTKSSETIVDSVFYTKGAVIKTYGGFEPRVSFRYNIDDYSSVRVSYNRINQYINLVSNTSVMSPTDLWKLSDTYSKPLISDQVALGYFKNTKNNDYETSVEVYYKPYKNVIEYKNGAQIFLNNHIETDLIPAKGKSFGLEIYAKKNTGSFTGWVSYTLSKSLRRTISNNPLEQINGNSWYPDNLDRLHNLVINGGYYLNKRIKIGFTFNYNTGRPVTLPELKYMVKGNQIVYYSDRNKYKMPDYHRLDLSISRFESLRIKKKWKGYWTLSVINAYGRKNAYTIFYQRDRSPYKYDEGRFNLYKLYIIGRPLPTFTYNFVF